jgi:hypothetical protein
MNTNMMPDVVGPFDAMLTGWWMTGFKIHNSICPELLSTVADFQKSCSKDASDCALTTEQFENRISEGARIRCGPQEGEPGNDFRRDLQKIKVELSNLQQLMTVLRNKTDLASLRQLFCDAETELCTTQLEDIDIDSGVLAAVSLRKVWNMRDFPTTKHQSLSDGPVGLFRSFVKSIAESVFESLNDKTGFLINDAEDASNMQSSIEIPLNHDGTLTHQAVSRAVVIPTLPLHMRLVEFGPRATNVQQCDEILRIGWRQKMHADARLKQNIVECDRLMDLLGVASSIDGEIKELLSDKATRVLELFAQGEQMQA